MHRMTDSALLVAHRGVFLTAFLSVVCFTPFSVGGADVWQKCVGNTNAPIADGFGSGLIQNVQSIELFQGYVYAGVGIDSDTNLPSVWRSSDLVHWTNVSPVLSNATAILFMTHSDTAIFFGTQNSAGASAGQIWKSTDGSSWELFNAVHDGWTNSGKNIDALGNDGMTLFAGTGLTQTGGGQIWSRPVDGSSNWVHRFTLPDGVVPTWLYAVTINGTGTLFLTTSAWPISGPAQGWLYQSRDGGRTWATNAGVGNGFGNTNNLNLAWVLVFNGHLYGGIGNPAEGSQIWRVPTSNIDGPWTEVGVAHNGFGFGAANLEVHRATVAAGCLWVTTMSGAGLGSQVWRSSDGVTFTQSNVSGFTFGNRASSYCALTGFGTNVVWGGGTTNSGAQVWKTAPGWFVISEGTPADWMNQYGLTNDTQDTDGDCLLNWQEYVAEADPTDDGSTFAITNAQVIANEGFRLCWPSVSNRLYAVERSTNLVEAGFEAITNSVLPTPPMNVHTDATMFANPVYRIRVRLP